MRQASDMILAAFCYVTAMMVWKIGAVLIYYGQVDQWFVVLITTLVVVSGLTFQFEAVINKYEHRSTPPEAGVAKQMPQYPRD